MTNASRDQNYIPVLMATSSSDGKTPIPVYADPTTHRLLTTTLSNADFNNVYNIKDYGAAVDGVTDDTSAVNSAIAAAQAAGGGTIFFPEGITLISGAISISVTLGHAAPGTLPYQTPLRFTGIGPSWNGYWTGIGIPPTGSILDLRFNGDGGTHVAKIDTRGAGFLEMDHLILKSGGTDSFQFFQTTNTTVFIHENVFWGNGTSGGYPSQDAIRLGGDGSGNVQSADAQAIFQGYGSKIQNNFYHKIQKCIVFGAQCNGIEVQNETVSKTCGSALATGAPFFFEGSGPGGGAAGVIIRSGTLEITNYKYAISLDHTSGCLFDAIGVYDDLGYTVGTCYVDASSYANMAIRGWGDLTFWNGPGASDNTLISGTHSARSNFPRGLIVGSADGKGGVNTDSVVNLTSLSTIDVDSRPLGTNLTIDTGTGGSYLNTKAYSNRFYDQAGNLQAEIMPGKASGAIRPGAGATGSRPSASTAGAGAIWFDTTLGKLLVSTGSAWQVITSV